MSTPHETFELGDFVLDSGQTLPGAQIAYTTYGELNDARDNVIVWPTWFTGTHAEHEWMIGEGDALDTSKYFVVVPSMFANGLSSSPSPTIHSCSACVPVNQLGQTIALSRAPFSSPYVV